MKFTAFVFVLLLQINLTAQEVLPVSDTTPVTMNGLMAGYSVKSETVKEVGDKGNFTRFQVQFYVTNTSSEAKIILHKQGGISIAAGNTVSPNLAQFKCSNATGARMTSKEWTLQAKQCIVDAVTEETNPSTNKTVQTKRPANIGYWIKPGETISSKSVVIVPLNEKPNITVTFFPGNVNTVGSVVNTNDANNNYQNNMQGFIRIKNVAYNNYVHNQNGPAACSDIDFNWWSAQWEIVPIRGTSYFNIRNRWKNNFLTTGNNEMISDDGQSQNAWWRLDDAGNNTYTIKNGANNLYLLLQNGKLTTSNAFGTPVYSQWQIEQAN